MKPQRSRMNGLRRAIGRFVAARRRRNAIRVTQEDLDRLPPHLQSDIDWPARSNHEHE